MILNIIIIFAVINFWSITSIKAEYVWRLCYDFPIRLYRIAAERRMRQQQDKELMELVRVGAIQYEDIAKHRALYNQRQVRVTLQT